LFHYADADADAAGVVVAAAAAAAAAAAGAAAAVQIVPFAAFNGTWQPVHFPGGTTAGEPAVVVTAGLCIKFDAAEAVVVTAAVLDLVVLDVGVHVIPVTTHAVQSTVTGAVVAVAVVAAAVAGAVAAVAVVATAVAVAGAEQIHEHPLFQCTAPLCVVDMYLRTNVPPHESVTHSCLWLQLIL